MRVLGEVLEWLGYVPGMGLEAMALYQLGNYLSIPTRMFVQVLTG